MRSPTPDEFHQFVVKIVAKGDDLFEIISPDYQNTFVPLNQDIGCLSGWKNVPPRKERAYDKSSTLLFVGFRQVAHRIDDLNASVLIKRDEGCILWSVPYPSGTLNGGKFYVCPKVKLTRW